MELRKKLERDFQSLKGTGDSRSPPLPALPQPGVVLTPPCPHR